MEFVEYTFKTEICIEKPPTGAGNNIKAIAQQISALMNTSGGLILLYSNTPDSDGKRDRWMMGFEFYLTNNWIPEQLLQELVSYQYLETESGQLRIYVFVSKSTSLVTFDFNAFGRLATGVRPIKDQMVLKLLNDSHNVNSERECESQLGNIPQKGNAFTIDDPIPATHRESETMEFKHCYVQQFGEESKKTELPLFSADKIKQRLGENMKYLCAFANTQGGSLVLGVEEENKKVPIVRGFPVDDYYEPEEKHLTQYLNDKLSQCIWHGEPGYKPVRGRDWNVFYHNVIAKDGRERKMIEVRITKHDGGMFLQSPVYYVVDRNGKIEENQNFHDWKIRFQTTTTTLHSDKTDAQGHLRKHIDKPDPEIKGKQVQDSGTLPGFEDQPQQVTAEAPAESKLPKSFKESQSEYKTAILIQGLSMHDCCTNKMTRNIKELQQEGEGDKIWYPSIEDIRKRLPGDAFSDKLMTFLREKEWKGLASIVEIEDQSDRAGRSDGHRLICNMLIVREREPPLLISCFGTSDQCEIKKQGLESLVDYALDNGRALKRQFLENTANRQHQSCLFHFDMDVLLVSREGIVKTIWESRKVRPVVYPNTCQEKQHTIACNGLSVELLRTRASVKDRYGQILIEHLTEAQAKVLHAEEKRVLIVVGKSGTGKTVIALHLAKEASDARKEGRVNEDIVYICSNDGLKSFVSSQVLCPVIVVKSTNSLSPAQKDLLKNASLIIIDDVHAIELDKNCKYWVSSSIALDIGDVDAMEIDDNMENKPDDLYVMLFKCAAEKNTRVAVFFDPEQDYKGNLPADFDKKLRNLAETHCGVMPQDITIVALRERIRNSQEINRFMQANQNQAKIPGTIECLNERPGDDVVYQYIGSSVQESAKVMNEKLVVLEAKYEPRSVAILCDDHEQMEGIKTQMIDQHYRYFQDENVYPIQHTVITNLENFAGLEAEVILFLLPRNFRTANVKMNWKYINVISSRARERLEFLLPWKPANEEEELDDRLLNLLELFKIVSTELSM